MWNIKLYTVFKAKNYYFLTEKKGCDRFTPPLYQPTVHLRFEIWAPTSFLVIGIFVYIKWPLLLLARMSQWQNSKCICAENLNKTSLALMVTSKFVYIFVHLLSSRLYLRRNSKRKLQDMVERKITRTNLEMFC
jgi:hypothetical protein